MKGTTFKLSNLSAKLTSKQSEKVIPVDKIIRTKSRERSRLKISKFVRDLKHQFFIRKNIQIIGGRHYKSCSNDFSENLEDSGHQAIKKKSNNPKTLLKVFSKFSDTGFIHSNTGTLHQSIWLT